MAGFTLVELLVTITVLVLVLTLAMPRLWLLSSAVRVRLAAAELVSILRLARATAIRRNSRVAVKFLEKGNGHVVYGLFGDGDGDGVLSSDIQSGSDPLLGSLRALDQLGGDVRLGFPKGLSPRDPGDPGRRLDRLDDPIRLNRSNLASFNSLGGSSPGSLYLTDGRHHLAAVRLFGRTGKIRVLFYDRAAEEWR